MDDEYCAARQLNAVVNNLAFLQSWYGMPNMPFGGDEHIHHVAEAATWKDLWLGYIRHKSNTLYVDIQVKGKLGRIGYIELLYNEVIIGSAQSTEPPQGWVSMSSPIDLTAQGLVIGNHYPIQVRHKSSEDYHENTGRCYFIYEADIPIPNNTGTWQELLAWEHLDPGRGNTATEYPQFYTFSQNLLWLKGHLHSANWAVRKPGFQANKIDGCFCSYGIMHKSRWLYHLGAGTIIFMGFSHAFADVNPGSPMTEWGTLDLNELQWLPYGALYYIETERTPGEIYDRRFEDSTFELACAYEDITV